MSIEAGDGCDIDIGAGGGGRAFIGAVPAVVWIAGRAALILEDAYSPSVIDIEFRDARTLRSCQHIEDIIMAIAIWGKGTWNAQGRIHVDSDLAAGFTAAFRGDGEGIDGRLSRGGNGVRDGAVG